MSGLCGLMMVVGGALLPLDKEGCLLPAGHQGPHHCNTQDGPHQWEVDLDCDCEHCQECDGDYCIVYWRVYNLPKSAG